MKKVMIFTISALIIVGAIAQCNFSSRAKKFEIYSVGKYIKVDFNFSELSEEEFSEREKEDQVKDWLIFGLLFNSGLEADKINEITYDLPAIRYGYMTPVSNLEYGETRSKYIGDREIVALIPKCSGDERLDYLAHIADEHRKNLDEIPERIYVFQYEIDLDNYFALVTRMNDQDGGLLFTEDSGYIEKELGSIDDLEDFMNRVDDLTFAQIKFGDTLVVGGRKIRSRECGKITVEDIANIWQAEYRIKSQKEGLENVLGRMNNYLNYFGSEKDRNNYLKGIDDYRKYIEQLHLGFSLDPIYDYRAIAGLINGDYDLCMKRFENNQNPFNLSDLSDFHTVLVDNGFNTSEVLNGLDNNDEGPLLERILKVKEKNKNLAKYLLEIISEQRYQKARYDGNLQRTKVGMHLFYTDLLAKLWLSNIFFSSPGGQIPDFMNATIVPLAKIFETEFHKYDSTRAWFGQNEKGFQFADRKKRLLFARNISEIFAKSADPFIPDEEVTVSTYWGAAINWWNNHYEEISKFEPEYERLNEILKWSVITTWLISEDKGNLLGFLRNITVKKDYWFPDWIRSQKDLKYNQWFRIKFYPRNYMGNETETMPLLKSPQCTILGNECVISGGVSLPRVSKIKARPSVTKTGNSLIKAPLVEEVEVKFLNSLRGKIRLKTFKGHTYEINKNLKVIYNAKKGTKLTNKYAQIADAKFERALIKESNLFKIKTSQNGIDIGDLKIVNNNNGFSAGFECQAMDRGHFLTRGLSDCYDPVKYLRNSSEVEKFIILEPNKRFLIQTTGSKKWMHVEVGAEAEINLNKALHSRVSGNFADSKICGIRYFEEGTELNKLLFKRKVNTGSPMPKDPITLHATKSELLLGKGITQMKESMFQFSNRGYNRATRLLNEAIARDAGIKRSTLFYDEVNTILRNNRSMLKGQERVIKDFTEFYSHPDIKIVTAKMDKILGGTKAKAQDFIGLKGNKRLVVHDHPSLNNVDWNVDIERTLHITLESNPNAVLYKIPKKSLRNHRLELENTAPSYSVPEYKLKLKQSPRILPFNIGGDGEEEDDDEDNTLDLFILYIMDRADQEIEK